MNTQSIEQLALNVRDAFKTIPPSFWGMREGPFPRGWCADASQVLGAILRDHEYTDFVCVKGVRGEGETETHSWLAGHGLIIDITADQFKDAPRGVFIFRDSVWHKEFKNPEETRADYRQLRHSDFGGFNNLPALYQYITAKISNIY